MKLAFFSLNELGYFFMYEHPFYIKTSFVRIQVSNCGNLVEGCHGRNSASSQKKQLQMTVEKKVSLGTLMQQTHTPLDISTRGD